MQYTIKNSRTSGISITVHLCNWYVPKSRGDVSWLTSELENTRNRIWSFKDGDADSWGISQVKELWTSEIACQEPQLFVPIPASTVAKTHERLLSFTKRLCQEVEGFENGFGVIQRVEDVESKHTSINRLRHGTKGLHYHASQIRGKRIVLFDDVVTTGHTIIDQVAKLSSLGALEVRVITLARTVPFDQTVGLSGNLTPASTVIDVKSSPSDKTKTINVDFKRGYVEGPLAGQWQKTVWTDSGNSITRIEMDNGNSYEWGFLVADDGKVYQEDFVNNKRTGKGVYRWADGTVYFGDFVDGKRTGKGTLAWANGKKVYEGDFLEDWRTGKGVYRWANGNVYEGEFMKGWRTGKGVFRWADGDVYEGDFVDDTRTGKGVFRWANSGNVYEGDFVDGKGTGTGVIRWANGDVYEGDFVDYKRTGKESSAGPIVEMSTKGTCGR